MPVHHPISINRLSNDTRQQQEKDVIDIEEWLKDGDILATSVPNHSPPTTEPARLPTPVTPQQLLTSEVWMARLGHCEPRQLHLLQRRAKGLPQKLLTHPFRFIDHKIQAKIHKQPAQKSTPPASAPGQQFYMDYAFFRASTSNYSKPDTKTDRVIQSIDGFNGHLLIVDSFTKKAWVFLCTSKEPPLAEIRAFLKFYGGGSGIIRPYDATRAGNSHAPQHSERSSSQSLTMWLNQQEQTAHHKMEQWKDITERWAQWYAVFYMVRASQQNFGHTH
jgi:hypothetical protein